MIGSGVGGWGCVCVPSQAISHSEGLRGGLALQSEPTLELLVQPVGEPCFLSARLVWGRAGALSATRVEAI